MMLFEHEAISPSVQHHPRDLASVNAMKQMCVIIILAYFIWFQPKPHWKRRFNIKISFFLHWISLNKMASAPNFRMSLCRLNAIDVHNVFTIQSIGEMISQDSNVFPCNVM